MVTRHAWQKHIRVRIFEYLVYAIIGPALGSSFIHMTGRKSIQLRRENEIVSTDGETRGKEERRNLLWWILRHGSPGR